MELSEEIDRHGLGDGGVAETVAGTPTAVGVDVGADVRLPGGHVLLGIWPIRPRRMRRRRPSQELC
jgi:hypothetical protein